MYPNGTADGAKPGTDVGALTWLGEQDGSVAYRLSVAGGRFRWTRDRHEVATAAWRDHWWDVRRTEGDEVVLSLVGGSVAGRTRVALVDHVGRRATTFSAGEPMSRTHIGVVRDSWDRVTMVVRADGPTGLHVVNPMGELLALTSRRRSPDGNGSDILVTPAGAASGPAQMFGVTLALELLRAGGLRRVA